MVVNGYKALIDILQKGIVFVTIKWKKSCAIQCSFILTKQKNKILNLRLQMCDFPTMTLEQLLN